MSNPAIPIPSQCPIPPQMAALDKRAGLDSVSPDPALGGEGTRTLGGEAEYDYDEAGWGSDDYYDEDY